MNALQAVARTGWMTALALLFVLQPARAQSEGEAPSADDSSPHSEAQLVSEKEGVRPGSPITVALRLQMEEGWHSYWKNPGDSGEPTSIEWALPDGFTASAIKWPYPHRIEAGPFTSYGYSDEVLLLSTVTPPEDLEPGTSVTLEGKSKWLICAEVCLPAEEQISLTLPVRGQEPPPSSWKEPIAAARAKLPKQIPEWDVRATRSAGSYALKITPPEGRSPELEGAYFFSAKKAVLAHAAPQPVSRAEGSYLIALQQSEYAQKPAERLRGVLVTPDGQAWSDDGAVRALAVDVPVEEAQAVGQAATASSSSMTLLWALLFAFGGGLILNLMPCVFPILSVKVLGFVRQASEDRAAIRRHGLLFGAGVIVSFWVLAGVLLILRAGGTEIGWGFQLQSPIFVALMALLFFGIGLSLLGVLEVGTGLMSWGGRVQAATDTSSYGESFLSGVLATTVATPCTAPLMGAALGFALTLTTTGALLIFTALGVGMAVPYVALSMAPRLLKRLPEPGGWMETFKQVLAFPMFVTTVWLIWVFGQQVGVDGMAFLLLGLLLLAMAAWMLSRWSTARVSSRVRLVTRTLAVLTLAGAVGAGITGAGYEAPAVRAASSSTDLAWQDFSRKRVEQLREQGRPVFVDFTAAWCLTCQVNERTTLSAASVRRAFQNKGVSLLKADWTSRSPEITRALESHGRSGVPLYVLYKGDESEPMLLPEILTEDVVLDALSELPPEEPGVKATAAAVDN